MNTKIINVVAAAIKKDGKILCAQRPEGKTLAGLWEFPGGKIEQNESPEQALLREIREELNVEIAISKYINEASYNYNFGTVIMKTYEARLISGELKKLEHQNFLWLYPSELNTLDWAPVDLPAVDLISRNCNL